MKFWQLRLGENKPKKHDDKPDWRPDWREICLAPKHSLVTIGYSIKEDIRPMTNDGIEDHINKVQAKHKKSPLAIKSYVRQTLNFKNYIKKDDYFISPINYLDADWNIIRKGSAGNYRIGQIVSKEIETLESLFGKGLSAYLKKYGYSNHLQDHLKMHHCRNIPTRKVKWLTDIFHNTDLIDAIRTKRYNGSRRGTVAELKFFTGKSPQDLVKNPKSITWL